MNATWLNCPNSRLRLASVCCLIASASLAASQASAKLILIDDFNDGDDEGWSHMDSNIGDPWGPGNYDALSGAYNLSTTGIVPERQVDRERGFMVSFWDESADPFYSEGFVRTKFRIDTLACLGVIQFRYSGDIESGLNGYSFVGGAGGGFSIQRITNTSSTGLGRLNVPGPLVGEEWWMEGGGVGDQLSMKVWRVGDPEPDAPQLVVVDSTYSTGVLGFDANMSWGSDTPGMVNATFDDVYFNVPPTFLLEVNVITGEMQLRNAADETVSFDFYQIDSKAGALDPVGWNSLSDQGVDALGDGVGESWDEAGGGSSSNTLAELFLLGDSTLEPGEALSLGKAYDSSFGTGDLDLQVSVIGHNAAITRVEYLASFENADFNGDGVIDGNDLIRFQRNFGATGQTDNSNGDANFYGVVDGADQAIWNVQFGGPLPVAAVVPEPGSMVLAAIALSIAGVSSPQSVRRRRRIARSKKPNVQLLAEVRHDRR